MYIDTFSNKNSLLNLKIFLKMILCIKINIMNRKYLLFLFFIMRKKLLNKLVMNPIDKIASQFNKKIIIINMVKRYNKSKN